MDKIMLCMDVGGTELKCAAIKNGQLLTEILHFPACADLEKQELLQHFANIFLKLAKMLSGSTIDGLRLAFPGPFNYENGISLIQGLDKFEALYNTNLRYELFARLSNLISDSMQIKFLNDVAAFALGELNFGSAANTERSMFVCIGTGCGSAFGLGNQLAPRKTPGVPPNGYIYPYPFLDGCIDDYISKRGLQNLAMKILGQPLEGRQLADLVKQGDSRARQCFLQFGRNLCEAIKPFLEDYKPECICIGGQITKSFELFGGALEEYCGQNKIQLYTTVNTSERTIQGIYTI